MAHLRTAVHYGTMYTQHTLIMIRIVDESTATIWLPGLRNYLLFGNAPQLVHRRNDLTLHCRGIQTQTQSPQLRSLTEGLGRG